MNSAAGKAISGTAFATLLLIALMMGGNHVAARIAFNNGVDVATAMVFRSVVTALWAWLIYRRAPERALVLAWLILGQAIALVQVAGALLAVSAVVALGLRKR